MDALPELSGRSLGIAVLIALWLVLALAERTVAAGYRLEPQGPRWLRHVGLALLGSLAVAVLLPGGAIAAALWAHDRSLGLLPQLGLSWPLAFVLTCVVYDLAIYWQHRAFHRWPWLWRLHAVHHCDTSIDLSTGVRFHPLEILLSMSWKMAIAVALGALPEAVLVYELILTGMALFNHADYRLPDRLERALLWLLVTPVMHRIHHSDKRIETDSNYGNALSLWDRQFGSYTDAPSAGLRIGLERWREAKDQRLGRMLSLPFRRDWRKASEA